MALHLNSNNMNSLDYLILIIIIIIIIIIPEQLHTNLEVFPLSGLKLLRMFQKFTWKYGNITIKPIYNPN